MESEGKMKRTSIRQLIGAGLVGSALASGCTHTGPVLHSSQQGNPSANTGTKTTPAPARKSVPEAAPDAAGASTTGPAGATSATSQSWSPYGSLTVAKGPAAPEVPVAAPSSPEEKPAAYGPTYGHAEDYSWLSGEVEYVHSKGVWRFRYASVDADDPYGGCVTLLDDGQLGSLRDGQYCRIRGYLHDPDNHTSTTTYRLEVIEPLHR